MSLLLELKKDVNSLVNKKRAKSSLWFFKTGKGEYGEGDKFLGLSVPDQRKIAKKYKDLSLDDLGKLIKSEFHEHRLIALFILVHQFEKFEKGEEKLCEKIYKFYLKNTKYINNWDLVDSSAHKIVGVYLLDRPCEILYKLARSKSLWERRISVISTFAFINIGEFKDSLKISEILLKDEHDLIHKAVGWMLREIGKKNLNVLEKFLSKHCRKMPRTSLRYAIEKLSEGKRREYMGR